MTVKEKTDFLNMTKSRINSAVNFYKFFRLKISKKNIKGAGIYEERAITGHKKGFKETDIFFESFGKSYVVQERLLPNLQGDYTGSANCVYILFRLEDC